MYIVYIKSYELENSLEADFRNNEFLLDKDVSLNTKIKITHNIVKSINSSHTYRNLNNTVLVILP